MVGSSYRVSMFTCPVRASVSWPWGAGALAPRLPSGDWRDETAPIPSSLPSPAFGAHWPSVPARDHHPGRPLYLRFGLSYRDVEETFEHYDEHAVAISRFADLPS
jgi:hypothetical protein